MSSIPKDTEIIVYCSVGFRSGSVAKKLIKNGYTNVLNLYGGLFEWSNQELPLVDNDGKPTLKIHTYNKKWGKWVEKGEKVL
jgi:3-mercaptopyruvate sulfurtransferase SseA